MIEIQVILVTLGCGVPARVQPCLPVSVSVSSYLPAHHRATSVVKGQNNL
jgi:hypothetical protein